MLSQPCPFMSFSYSSSPSANQTRAKMRYRSPSRSPSRSSRKYYYQRSPRRGYYRRSPSRSPPRGRYGGSSRVSSAPTSLLVRNIRRDIRPEDLRVAFREFGHIKDIYLPRDYYTGEPRGFGFVQYYDPADAAEAKYQMDRTILHGREIAVVFAEESRKRPEEMRRKTKPRHGYSPRYYDSHHGYSRSRSRSRSRSLSRSRSGSLSPPRHSRALSHGRYDSREHSYDRRQREYSYTPSRSYSRSRSPSRSRSYSPSRSYSRSPDRRHRSRSVSSRR